MNARISLLTVALIAMAPAAYAGSPGSAEDMGYGGDPITELANFTGLSERRVQMILGCRTCFAEYVYTYARSVDKFKRALGNERYERLVAGLPIDLERQSGERVIVAIDARPHLSSVP